ncbi:peptidylprolyl isomerase [Planktomarina sp.]|uniref:peptidylprolyl isomerase n=1 Tax=Planktomarina sp. TaxID=2024851 RepID=UPI003C3BE391
MIKITLRIGLAALVLIGSLNSAALAQGLFDPVISVNRAAITAYELEQRERFLEILQRSSGMAQLARDSLIEDRLKMAAADRASIKLSATQVTKAMEDFAGNANLGLDQLLASLAQSGVDAQTYRDFIKVGVTWRELVRARFAARSAPSEAEIDRALASAGAQGGVKVLLTEIVLPAGSAEELNRARQTAERLGRITSTADFSEQARRLSVAQSRVNGGRLEWANLSDLPDGLRPIISGLRPGQITKPLEVTNAIVLFQLRDVAETTAQSPEVAAIEYARLSGPAEAVQTAVQMADTCDDFYGAVKADPALSFKIHSESPDQISQALSLRLMGLDKDEFDAVPTSEGDQAEIVMLCARVYAALEDVSRGQVADNLRSARISSLADGFLAELRASADIVYH